MTDTPQQEFEAWWRASKYCQVFTPEEHWHQIALDGFQAGRASAAPSDSDKADLLAAATALEGSGFASRVRLAAVLRRMAGDSK